jgi:membrane protein required for beta-lactamase induction
MTAVAGFLVIIFLAVGCVLGWHANRARAAHGDVKATKGRLPGFRRTRQRSGLITLGIAAVVILVIYALLRGLPHG